ncbi:MAG: hypothetical protein ACFFF4_13435, partial [Candidatus Thorarchaeota archaeon]
GAILTRSIPHNMRNIGLSIVLGLLLNCILIQVQMSLKLLFDFSIELYLWLLLGDTILVFSALGYLWVFDKDDKGQIGLGFKIDRILSYILVIALVIRIAMLWFASQSIAPDACLYSDYARSIIDGSFQTNVIGDNRVYTLWNDTDYSFHQGMTYFFAISWLLMTPGISGPTLILSIAGVALISVSYDVATYYISKRAGYAIAVALTIHPLFVYHSSVAFGPEITSLLFLMTGFLLLVWNTKQNPVVYILAGICIGLVDVVWYANFLLLCVALPVFLLVDDKHDYKTGIFLSFCMGFVLLARIFFETPYLFYLFWSAVAGIVLITRLAVKKWNLHQIGFFFIGIFFIMVIWRWPIQLLEYTGSESMYAMRVTPIMLQAPNPDLTNLIGVITPELVLDFLLYIIGHIGLAILILVPVALVRAENRRNSLAFVMFAFVCIGGTLLLFSSFSTFKAVLLPIYYFSDSRFFLFISLNLMIPTMAVAAQIKRSVPLAVRMRSISSKFDTIQTKSFGVVILVSMTLGIGYLVIPSGLIQINFESRYGWTGLQTTIDEIGEVDSVFIVDRASEFAWLVNRPTVQLHFSGIGLVTRTTLAGLNLQATRYDAQYFIMDSFTQARWDSLYVLLDAQLSHGDSVVLEPWRLAQLDLLNETGEISTITLIDDTKEYSQGTGVRIFEFDNSSFSRKSTIDNLASGWNTTDSGTISSGPYGFSVIQIGSDGIQTKTYRSEGFNLNQEVEGGFLVVEFYEVNATIDGIYAYDSAGNEIAYSVEISHNAYFLALGHTTIGDIQIHCSGNPGDYVILRHMILWEKTT